MDFHNKKERVSPQTVFWKGGVARDQNGGLATRDYIAAGCTASTGGRATAAGCSASTIFGNMDGHGVTSKNESSSGKVTDFEVPPLLHVHIRWRHSAVAP